MYEETPDEKIHVEFGDVEAGSTAVKWIEIVNTTCAEQIYEARRDATTNPLDHVFELCNYSWSLPRDQLYKCKIYYRPFVPFSINVDYFTIVNSSGQRTEVAVHGTCIGPVLSSSMTRLVMICEREKQTKKRIKLVNDSEATATFMFDIDHDQSSFKVDVGHGYIGSRSYRYITITFAPWQVGIYACHLPCLILNHKPIIIEVYGYCGSTLHKADIQNHLNYSANTKNGFEGYTSDTIVAANNLPVISLSKNYIDFGQIETENAAQRISETLCLTNHSQSDVLIKWNQDLKGIFVIKPSNVKIPAYQTTLFEILFNPDVKNNIFARELIGYILINEQEDYYNEKGLAFPMVTSIRLIGRSFSILSDDPIPRCQIPQTIKMPPCLPSSIVYTTFLIKKFEQLALLYRFIPPSSSHFVVKPMMGIIHGNYQIIIVGMLPEAENERIYMERWTIRFNGNPKSDYFIDFSGFAGCANIIFNNQNVVSFTSCFPCCQQLKQFSMRNVSRHVIKYEFKNIPSEIKIQDTNGEICSNGIITHEWKFCPVTIGEYNFEIKCILTVLKNEIPMGANIVTLHLIGKCETGFLLSVPDELHVGTHAYNTTKEFNFDVFNRSPINIYYKMISSHCSCAIGDIDHDVQIHPSVGTIISGQNKRITVSITFRAIGYYELYIQYLMRINRHTHTLIPNQTPRKICKLHCFCVLPTITVKDLYCCSSCPHMSKTFLWKLMKIDMLNTLLRNLQPGMSETLYINFPAMILQDNPIIIKLLLINTTVVIASWNIKRVQLCLCRCITNEKALSFRHVKYNCLHRRAYSLIPKMEKIKPQKEIWVTLELCYILLGKTEAKWDLDLGDNRHISLIMTLEGLSGTERRLHIFNDMHFRFQNIYFAEKNPTYQVYWIHNNMNNNVPFSINTEVLQKINQEYCYELFSCATLHGVVKSQSSFPILLKFQPRQFGIFKCKLFLTLGDEEYEIILEGESVLPHRKQISGKYVPPNCNFKSDDIPIYFNTDCIDISHISTHSHVIKMIIMYNHLKHDVFAYEWKRYEIPGVINVEIHPRKGIIKPMTVQSFTAFINSGGYPSVIDINIPCEFINTSQRRTYQRSIYKYIDLSQELKEQFTITEMGISIPKPSIEVLNKSLPFYKTITIRCCIFSLEDKFLKINLMEELLSAPQNTVRIEKNKKQTVIFAEEDINVSSFILEGLLWDIVNSKLFQNQMQIILRDKLNLFYSQFTMNLFERKKQIRRSYISPPRALISRILEKMLMIIMHEEFALGIIHLIEHTDIRHTGDLNIVSSINRRKTIKSDTRLVYEQKRLPAKISKRVSSSRISFVEKS